MAAAEGISHIIRYANPAFCLLVGKSKAELIGSAFSGAVPAEGECLQLLDRVYETGQPEAYTCLEHSASHPFWSYSMWKLLGLDDHPAGVIIQVTETTAFHRQMAAANQELLMGSVRQHELAETAENLNVRLERANEDLRQFAFAAAHDLREPLRMIGSYSQLLVRRYRSQLDENASQYMDQIEGGTRRMAQLLDDLLSYARLGADAEEPAGTVDLNVIREDIKENLDIAIEESGAVVTSGDLPSVRGRAAYFGQLLQNLIGNAIKYRGERPPRIHVSAEELNGEWLFAVADNGMGIAPEYREQIFGIFKRLHGREIPGTGIGLAICRRVVERYGGRIWVESEPGQGTTFYFTLPAETEPEA